jgi:hypothetical protein
MEAETVTRKIGYTIWGLIVEAIDEAVERGWTPYFDDGD